MMFCPDCEGTGEGVCMNCGDLFQECCCDDPNCDECSRCDGTGECPDDEFDETDLALGAGAKEDK